MRICNGDRIRLLITDVCNYRCTYCHNEGQFSRGNFISIPIVEQLSEWFSSEKVKIRTITISGGEPTLHPELLSIVKNLRQVTENVSLVTNGEKLSYQRIDELAQAGIKYIKFGIDSVSSCSTKPFDQSINSTPSHILDNARYAATVLPGSLLNTVVSCFNMHKLREVLDWCEKNGMGVKFLELIEPFKNIKNTNSPNDQHKHHWFSILYNNLHANLSNVRYDANVMKFYASSLKGHSIQFSENFCAYRACSSLWTRIDCQGRLIPCIQRPVAYPINFGSRISDQFIFNNRKMTETWRWPCGKGPTKLDVLDNAIFLTLPDGNQKMIPTSATSHKFCP